MNTKNISKTVIAGIIAAVIIVGFILYSFLGGSSNNKKEKQQSQSIFSSTSVPRTQQTIAPQTTAPASSQVPYTQSEKLALSKLDTTGVLDPAYPDEYLSPRYEAILGGDISSGIPITELNKATNSDLDATTFEVSRQLAIDITRATATGEGEAQWPSYFQGSGGGQCTHFKADVAGAISLPYPNDADRWIVAYVYWEAKCSGESKAIRQMSRVYFSVDNFQLTPRRYSEIPKS